MDNFYYVTLKNRGLITLTGPDARPFLQGLISNDINLLDKQPCVYACLLTAQGKFLHDFFITEANGKILIDCEGGERAKDLFRRLSMYKLRVKVEMEVKEDVEVYLILSSPAKAEDLVEFRGPPVKPGDDNIWIDPRHPAIGYRSFTKPALEEKPFDAWDRHRILLTVPDGSRDMIPEKSTLLECNIDKLNGISFEKGCYVGQELTARMHYRGLAKKHLYTVTLPLPADFTGEILSSAGEVGLALIRDKDYQEYVSA